jgi:hypothetical protein
VSGTDPIVLYSTNTWLSYVIGERFYGGEHYVWCTPDFDARALPRIDQVTPPSSSPAEIYRDLHEDVRRGDQHSSKIKDSKAGILRGVEAKRAAGSISDADQREIVSMIERATGRDFRPLLYVIPFERVRANIAAAPVELRAHPLSREFIIERLPRSDFDVLELPLGGL